MTYIIHNYQQISQHKPPGAILSNLRDDIEDLSRYIVTLPIQISNMLFLAFALFTLIRTERFLTLQAFAPLLISCGMLYLSMDKVRSLDQKNRKLTDQVLDFIHRSFHAWETIQLYGAQPWFSCHFSRLNQNRLNVHVKQLVLTKGLGLLFENFSNLGLFLILILSGKLILAQTLTIGDLALFIFYLTYATGVMTDLSYFFLSHKKLSIAIKRLVAIFSPTEAPQLISYNPAFKHETPICPNAQPANRFSGLSAINLCYTFPGDGFSIQHVNLSLSQGSLTVLVGKTGSGKSTILRLILGLLPLEYGRIYGGHTRITPLELQAYTGYLPQFPHFFNASICENIVLDQPLYLPRLERALYLAVLDTDMDQFENSVHTLIGPNGCRLSSGQKVRLAAARMFYRQADFFVIDDGLGALDTKTRALFWKRAIHDARHPHNTFLVVSHDRHILDQAQHIVVVDKGRAVASGTFGAVYKTCNLMRKIWHPT